MAHRKDSADRDAELVSCLYPTVLAELPLPLKLLTSTRARLPKQVLGQPVALKFDLKGSEFGRKASQHELSKGAEATLKDLDFDRVFPAKFGGLRIRPADYEKLAHRINEDARVRPHSLQPALGATVVLKHASPDRAGRYWHSSRLSTTPCCWRATRFLAEPSSSAAFPRPPSTPSTPSTESANALRTTSRRRQASSKAQG